MTPPACFVFGLVGFPLSHSLSPRLHKAALDFYGFQGEYRLIPIDPSDPVEAKLKLLLDELRKGRLQGLNVTIPYKQAVLPLLDRLTPSAQGVGAVNTIYCRDGELVGENTDAAGFLADLSRKFPEMICGEKETAGLEKPENTIPKTALVLGAGGSARAVVYALSQAGWTVVVAARRLTQALELAGDFSTDTSLVCGQGLTLSALQDTTERWNICLIVNTTPLGMRSYEQASPWPDGLAFPPQARIYDLVYNPPRTILLEQARQAGREAVNGLGMLLEQAALSFERWTGIRPPLKVLQAVIKDDEKI